MERMEENSLKSYNSSFEIPSHSEELNVEEIPPSSIKSNNFILEKFFTHTIGSGKDSSKNALTSKEAKNRNDVELLSSSEATASLNQNDVNEINTETTTAPQPKTRKMLEDIERESISSRLTYSIYKEENEISSKEISKTKGNRANEITYLNKSSSISTNNSIESLPVGDIVVHSSPGTKNFVKSIHEIHHTSNDDSVVSHNTSEKSSKLKNKSKNKSNYNKKKKSESQVNLLAHDSISNEEIYHDNDRIISAPTSEDEIIFNKDVNTEASPEDYVGIYIYKTDILLLNSLIKHPLVKVHIVDRVTGEYLQKIQMKKQTDSTRIDNYVTPLLTKPFNLQENRSLIPEWKELLIFETNFNRLLKEDASVIIFFEILDFLSFSAASLKYQKEGKNCGWYKIAWAFVKPINKDRNLNINKTVRLQLYKPKKNSPKISSRICIIHNWWTTGYRKKYPSTIYVNVKNIACNTLEQSPDSKLALNYDNTETAVGRNDASYGKVDDKIIHKSNGNNGDKLIELSTNSSKISNKINAKLKSGKYGCSIMKFDTNGTILACAICEDTSYPIIIYSVQDYSVYCKLPGHQSLIYDLDWSVNNEYLISASADFTVLVWNVRKNVYQLKQILPHPSFVYCAQLNKVKCEIVTGCYDQIIRVWTSSKELSSDLKLVQELDGHLGYVTSLCYGKDAETLYSSDNKGVLICWVLENKNWKLLRVLNFKELNNIVINNIVLHPKAKRLLICCRDGICRMIDLTTTCIMQWFRGSKISRFRMVGCISFCGNLIILPSEDGKTRIWHSDTGILQATYMPYLTEQKISLPHCIQCHPADQLIAISCYGTHLPVLICRLKILTNTSHFGHKSQTDIRDSGSDIAHISNRKYVNEDSKEDKPVNFRAVYEKINKLLIIAQKK